MALVSPGVQVTVTDESFFSSAGPGTVPLILIATKQDKLTPDGTGIAAGTTAANADSLFLIASQRELLQTFGDPNFNEVGGSAQNGYPLNEYGLLASYSFLGAANRAYVVRADVDLDELDPTSVAPAGAAPDNTYWLDTTATSTINGLFSWSSAGAWEALTNLIVVDTETITNGNAEPSSGYQNGNRVVNYRSDGTIVYFERVAGAWLIIGNPAHRAAGGGTDFQWAPHAGEPDKQSDDSTALATGDLWLKTSTPNGGLDLSISHYDSSLGQSVTDTVSSIEDTHAGYYALTGVSSNNIAAGTIVGFIDSQDSYDTTVPGGPSTNRPLSPQILSEADISLQMHNGAATTVFTGSTAVAGVITDDTTTVFTLNGTATTTFGTAVTAVMTGIDEVIIALNLDPALTSNSVVATKSATDQVILTATDGRDIVITAASTSVIGELYIINGTTSNFRTIAEAITDNLVDTYNVQSTAPTGTTVAGTYWYDPSFIVDILVNGGNAVWNEVAGTIYVQSDEPTVTIDSVWVETDQVNDYPVIYRNNVAVDAWVLVDNTDQTTSAGIVFADARVNSAQSNADLDLDAPDPRLYPGGTLLFNTRYSGRNVKIWTENATALTSAPTVLVDRWVSSSGNNQDGSLITGQRAQKAVVTQALAAVLVGNEEIRDDTIFFNLIAVPGYEELIDEMVALNVDRKEQAFVLGDSPFNLSNSTTALQAWASNSANAAGNGEDGLVTADSYLGVYYPSGLSTNTDGSEVVVPSSHMMLRVMAQNDNVAYPWYAPAGFTRGTVTNASAVGYLDSNDEFVPVSLTQGQRDVLQQNNVNPIANIPNRGLVAFGQKTRQATSSALDRINVARLVNYVRYQADQLAQPFLFEPNDTVTRGAVKDAFDAFLAELVTLRGLNDFLVVVDESNNTPARIDANELWIDIAIQPIKSVEFIFIPIRIQNTGDDLNL